MESVAVSLFVQQSLGKPAPGEDQQNPIPKITAVEFAVFLELLKAFELNL